MATRTHPPTERDLAFLLRSVQRPLNRALDVTIGWDPEDGDWIYQLGGNIHKSGAYAFPVWAAITMDHKSNPQKLARDLINQLLAQAKQR